MDDKLTTKGQLKESITKAKSFCNSLIGELANAVTEAIEEIESTKNDKQRSVSIIISESGWANDGSAGYPYYYDISVDGITENDVANIVIAPGSMSVAIDCELCPTSETLEGVIRIRSAQIPASGINAEYRIEQGKEA